MDNKMSEVDTGSLTIRVMLFHLLLAVLTYLKIHMISVIHYLNYPARLRNSD